MDTGGLAFAQMTYNKQFASDVSLASPPGYAARERSQLKRLSMNGLTMEQDERSQSNPSTPRTSRSHLLAGLRTAARANGFAPTSAPPTKVEFGLDSSRFAQDRNQPRSAASTTPNFRFSQTPQYGMNGRYMYSVPEQVLAPPQIQINDGHDKIDQMEYAELLARKLQLEQQQAQLQHQLRLQGQYINVQNATAAAAQQLQNMQLNNPQYATQQNMMNLYAQQAAMQPVIQPVIGGQTGLYSVYNPMTGQSSLFIDTNAQQQAQSQQAYAASVSSPSAQSEFSNSTKSSRFQSQLSSPTVYSPISQRALSPPGLSGSPVHSQPVGNAGGLAFRRGHKKVSSLSASMSHVSELVDNGPKTSLPRTSGFPMTPVSGSFAPGHNRSGEHPSRQPRGPPQLEELVAKPTSKHEGSKNFATRQRRRAVHSLVRAGMERRNGRGSSGSMTPVSESENLNFGSDNDSVGSGRSLSNKPSIGSLRAARAGVIGAERRSQSLERRDECAIATE